MDSVTQIVLGATVASVCVPKEQRRKAIVMGAALGTLPDLDVFIDYGTEVANFTLHRGFSHSLFVLAPFAISLWLLLKRFYSPVRDSPKPWFWAITLALITHPLLDAHTAYGTQLFWPLDVTPTMWSTLFIIDPLYTLPLLIATLLTLFVPDKNWTKKVLVSSLILSCSYLCWSWVAKYQVTQQVNNTLNTSEVKVFTTPTPFNTILWRVVVMQDDTYLEGYYHFLHPGEIKFNEFETNLQLFNQADDFAEVKQLQWFADGFNRADVIDGFLVISDLRMGFEDNYVFRHQVANRTRGSWLEIASTRLPRQLNSDDLVTFWEMFNNPQ